MLKHTKKRNFTTATKYGKVTFDKDGISKDLTQEQQKELAGVIDVYEYEADTDTKSTAKKAEPKKEETKADEKEEAPKKTTTRKTTTRKTTAKKDTEDK